MISLLILKGRGRLFMDESNYIDLVKIRIVYKL